jgi:hypothetical protein
MLIISLYILFLGVVLGGLGYWERRRAPMLYWSNMVVWTFMAIVAAYRLTVE